ncbi:MAG: UvrD-helicase domain-containing protein [Paludibacteraceae bacterium]|nr:UvrD-helicase domain-containing protein [Paludibacteraceae bacterium]
MNAKLIKCAASAGTGKTYTLAAHYVALLMNNESYKSILAVTFTNKATAEMKERILTFLHSIAEEIALKDTQNFLAVVRKVSKDCGLQTYDDAYYSDRAKKVLRDILSDYDNMRIMTIDTFLQSLLKGLAQALGQMAGYGVDLDTEHAITNAVDEVLSEEVAEDEAVKKAVVAGLEERLNSEEKWDLRPGLIDLAKMLYKENVQLYRDRLVFESDVLNDFRKSLKWQTKKEVKDLKDTIDPWKNMNPKMVSFGIDYVNWINRMQNCIEGKFFEEKDMFCMPGSRMQKSVEALCTQESAFKGPGDEQSLKNAMQKAIALSKGCRKHYLRWKYFNKHLDNLMIVDYVQKRIRKDLSESNTVLLAETANTLAQVLQSGDAEFVLLKAGIRYKHIMLDEFQDTSTLQWKNFERLILEILSQGNGTALIVGDVKQSIYRWRNGDYEIMNSLNENHPIWGAYYNKNILPLIKNMRSRKEVVRFNLQTMAKLSSGEDTSISGIYDEGYKRDDTNLEDYYFTKEDDKVKGVGHEGGYVRLKSFAPEDNSAKANEAAKTNLLTDMFEQIDKLLKDYSAKDMLILVRRSKEAKKVLARFNELVRAESGFENLKEQKIVSADSFLLESSPAINIIICALKAIYRDDAVAREFVLLNSKADAQTLSALKSYKQVPLTDMVERISRVCICGGGNVYEGTDIAHLNCLKDKIRKYVEQYGSNVEAFLTYWDDIMHSDALPSADSDGIRIMTIHASKGLEGKNVFLPFCDWEMESTSQKLKDPLWCEIPDLHTKDGQNAFLPLPDKDELKSLGFTNEYELEHKKQRIDNLNLLYVALTRAENNLFVNIYAKGNDNVGSMMLKAWGNDYEAGKLCLPQAGEKSSKPFDFKHVDSKNLVKADYRSYDAQIEFRQSQEAQDLMMQLDKKLMPSGGDSEESEYTRFGNLCHAILAKIVVKDDMQHVIDDFYQRGMIPDQAIKQKIEHLMSAIVNHPDVRQWFDGSWEVLREDTILLRNEQGCEEKRMDRVMIRGNQAVVLDYKFGGMQKKYTTQVQEYMKLMRALGYHDVKGYVWLGFEYKLLEIE